MESTMKNKIEFKNTYLTFRTEGVKHMSLVNFGLHLIHVNFRFYLSTRHAFSHERVI